MHVWHKASFYDASRGKPEAWLIMLTKSRAIDKLRGSQTRDRLTTSMDRDDFVPDQNFEYAEPNSADARISLDALVLRLTQEHRAVLEMAYYGGLTQSEIAVRLSIPLGTVKTRMRDGLLHLRKTLKTMETASK